VDNLDEIIHQSTRLRIVATLNTLAVKETLDFGALQSILGTTAGNLATHLAALEKAEYIEIRKEFLGKKPHTRIAFTLKGRRAFKNHVAYLKTVIANV
jgi:DNA-binding MarR family transcriptional regulator